MTTEHDKSLDEKTEAWNNALTELTELGRRRIVTCHKLEALMREYNTSKSTLQNELNDIDEKMENVNTAINAIREGWK